MRVASLELCKELFELSGWVTADFAYPTGHQPERDYPYFRPFKGMGPLCGDTPAYDLGYLIGKLPRKCPKHQKPLAFHTGFSDVDWFFGYGDLMMMDGCMCENGDTPQDAACKLAITMFKQGILKRD